MGEHAHDYRPRQHSHGRREKYAIGENRNSRGDYVRPCGHTAADSIHGQRDAKKPESDQKPRRDRQDYQSGVHETSYAELDAGVDEIQRTIEYMRPWHKNHAWANRDQAQR